MVSRSNKRNKINMKHIKLFENFSEENNKLNEGLRTKFLIPFLATLGYLNAQTKEIDRSIYKDLLIDKTELSVVDPDELIDDKAKLIYKFVNDSSDIDQANFDKFCRDNNINDKLLSKIINKTGGSFITNVKGFGNVYKANFNLNKNSSISFTKDPFSKHLGVNFKF